MNLYVGNFDFEHHLGRQKPPTLPAPIVRLNAEMAACLVATAESGDAVWMPDQPDSSYGEHLQSAGFPDVRFVSDVREVPGEAQLVPWGWTRSVKDWGTRNGWQCQCPDLEVVATVNSRVFSSGLEREWNVGLPSARTIHTLDDFRETAAAVCQESAPWVVKANFGMSARERILGRGVSPSHQELRWVERQLAATDAVYFEPWVEPIDEWGLQYTIPISGQPVLEGITPLLTDAQGTYRGSRLVSEEIPADVRQVVDRAALRIQETGYFGPLGIDVMRYRSADGEVGWRPLQDINARLTMGRLALGLRRLIAADEFASWLHVRWSDAMSATLTRLQSNGIRVIRISPLTVGNSPVSRGTVLVVAPSAALLRSAESVLIQIDAS